ncbi:MAG: toxin-antitoxin system YwqK family antitoxin [Ramlibacter sp.]
MFQFLRLSVCVGLVLALVACGGSDSVGPAVPGPSFMATAGLSLTQPTISPAAAGESSSTEPESGWWWNPAEGGRGYAIEKQGDKIFFAAFLYDAQGAPLWYVATGRIVAGVFNADLQHYVNGQTLTGAYKSPTTLPSPGKVAIEFTSGSTAVMSWPGGLVPLQRFDIIPGGSKLAASGTLQRGWWWNPTEGGRGFAMEIQGDAFFMAGFMYDGEGKPRWYLAQGSLSGPTTFSGKLVQYGGGQQLTGAYASPRITNDNVAPLTINFASANSVQMQPQGAAPIALSRYTFGDTTAAPAESKGTLLFPVGNSEGVSFVHLEPGSGSVYATARRSAAGKVQPVSLAVQVSGGGYYTIAYDANQLPTKVTANGYTFHFSNIDVVNDTVNIKVVEPDGTVVTLTDVEFSPSASAAAFRQAVALDRPLAECSNEGEPSECGIQRLEQEFDETALFFAAARHHLVVDILWGLAEQADQKYRVAVAKLKELSTAADAAYAKVKAKLADARSKGPQAGQQFQANDLVQQTQPFAVADGSTPEKVFSEARALRSGAATSALNGSASAKPVTPVQPPAASGASTLTNQIRAFLGCPVDSSLTIVTGTNVALLIKNDADLANATLSRAMCKNIGTINDYYAGKITGKLVIYQPAIAPSSFADEASMASVSEYVNSRRNGVQKEYFTDAAFRGVVRLASTWVDEKQDGTEIGYYTTGKPAQIQTWTNGFLVEHKTYYQNSQLADHDLYGNDGTRNFRQGEHKSYAETGVLISRKTFKNDFECGAFEYNNANGTPSSAGTFCDRESSGSKCSVRDYIQYYYSPSRKFRIRDSGDCNSSSTPA